VKIAERYIMRESKPDLQLIWTVRVKKRQLMDISEGRKIIKNQQRE